MKKIILDTNFLLIPFQFKVDIFSEIDRICDFSYELFVLDKSFDELRKISMQGGKEKMAARLAVSLVMAKKVKKHLTMPWQKNVDDILVSLSSKKDVIVATQDKELKKRLKCAVITMKGKSHLWIESR